MVFVLLFSIALFVFTWFSSIKLTNVAIQMGGSRNGEPARVDFALALSVVVMYISHSPTVAFLSTL